MHLDQNVATLRRTIRDLAEHYIPECENDEYRNTVLMFCEHTYTNLVLDLIRKMAKGQQKYGGNFFSCSRNDELRDELIDSINYNASALFTTAHPEARHLDEPKNYV